MLNNPHLGLLFLVLVLLLVHYVVQSPLRFLSLVMIPRRVSAPVPPLLLHLCLDPFLKSQRRSCCLFFYFFSVDSSFFLPFELLVLVEQFDLHCGPINNVFEVLINCASILIFIEKILVFNEHFLSRIFFNPLQKVLVQTALLLFEVLERSQ